MLKPGDDLHAALVTAIHEALSKAQDTPVRLADAAVAVFQPVLDKQTADNAAEVDRLRKQVEALTWSVGEIGDERDGWRERAETADRRYRNVAVELENAQAELAARTTTDEQNKAALAEQAAEIEQLRAAVELAEALKEQAVDYVEDLNKEIDYLERWNERFRLCWRSARRGRVKAREELECQLCLKNERGRAEARAESAEAALAEAEDRHSRKIADRDAEIAEAERQIRDVGAERDRLREAVAHYESTLTWHTTCHNCARLLDSCYAETMRAESAETALADHRETLAKALREREAETERADDAGANLLRILTAAQQASTPPDDLDDFVTEQVQSPAWIADYVTAALASGQTALALLARAREWIASNPVAGRNEFGEGYREALRDIGDVLAGRSVFNEADLSTEPPSLVQGASQSSTSLDQGASPPADANRADLRLYQRTDTDEWVIADQAGWVPGTYLTAVEATAAAVAHGDAHAALDAHFEGAVEWTETGLPPVGEGKSPQVGEP